MALVSKSAVPLPQLYKPLCDAGSTIPRTVFDAWDLAGCFMPANAWAAYSRWFVTAGGFKSFSAGLRTSALSWIAQHGENLPHHRYLMRCSGGLAKLQDLLPPRPSDEMCTVPWNRFLCAKRLPSEPFTLNVEPVMSLQPNGV